MFTAAMIAAIQQRSGLEAVENFSTVLPYLSPASYDRDKPCRRSHSHRHNPP